MAGAFKNGTRRIREWASLFAHTGFVPGQFRKRRYPHNIQFPITKMCNSRCVTCKIWEDRSGGGVEPENLRRLLRDPGFRQVRFVGINGGEPFLYDRLPEIVEALISGLPSLRSVNLITNGLLTDRTLKRLEELAGICRPRKVRLTLTVSLDGVGEVHDRVRGVPKAFDRTMATIQAIRKCPDRYCDRFSVFCTISKWNVHHLAELEAYAALHELPIRYHLAVPNRRIGTFDRHADYNVLHEMDTRQAAAEFFYIKYRRERHVREKFKYFAQYRFLVSGGSERLADCDWLKRDITLDDAFMVSLCATASREIGDLRKEGLDQILFRKSTRDHADEIRIHHCRSCIHYANFPNTPGLIRFVADTLREKYWKKLYERRSW
jgi:MoaA/NifB/PqqE/SkfB family radical SAM enzyme